ncbi:hypothetical protein EON65_32650 [archaeon]|nr:MAG: hypothetical protein EON65_32650 [archaeon]
MSRVFFVILYLALVVVALGVVVSNRDRKRMEHSGREHQQQHHGGQGWSHLVGQHSDAAIEAIRKERPDLQVVKVPKVNCQNIARCRA